MANKTLLIGLALALISLAGHALSHWHLSSLAEIHSESPYPILIGDSTRYIELSESIQRACGFSESEFATDRHWPPGYSSLLAVTDRVTGNPENILIIQVGLAILSTILLYGMSLKFIPGAWSTFPPLLYAVDPNVVLANTVILSDSIFSSLLIITVYLAFFAKWRPAWLRWFTVGLIISLLILIRPIAQFFVLLVPLAFLLHQYFSTDRPKLITQATSLTALMFGMCLLLLPWLSFVHSQSNTYEVSHVGARNLLYYNTRDFLAWEKMNETRAVPVFLASRLQSDPAYKQVDEMIKARQESFSSNTESYAQYDAAVALSFIKEDPFRYAYFHLVNTAPFFISSSYAAYKQVETSIRTNQGIFDPTALKLRAGWQGLKNGELSSVWPILPIVIEMLGWLSILVAAAFGLYAGRREVLTYLFLGLILYFAILTGPVSIARYRIPAEPFLSILAGLGFSSLWNIFKVYLASWPEAVRELGRYFIASGVAFGVDLTTLIILHQWLGFNYLVAAILAFLLGLTTIYFLSTWFVFQGYKYTDQLSRFIVFAVIGLVGLVFNELAIWVFFGLLGWWLVTAKFLSLTIVFSWNFVARKYILFNKNDARR